MAIKSILVAYSGDPQGSGSLHLALQMARKHGAHLTAVVPHGPSVSEARYGRHMNSEVRRLLRGRDEAAVERIRAYFDEQVAAAGLTGSATFLDLKMRSGFTLTACVPNYDIVVMGRRAFVPGFEHFGVRPEDVVVNSGRPILLVPGDYAAPELNEHAVIAWDGRRAATRALGDAMPLLTSKRQVTILSIGDAAPQPPAGDDVVALLHRHGVPASLVTRRAGPGGITGTILDLCREVGAGILIMGAYQHSRLAEEILGGVTQDILADAPLPVFMSH